MLDKATWIFQFRIIEWSILGVVTLVPLLMNYAIVRSDYVKQNYYILYTDGQSITDAATELWLKAFPAWSHEYIIPYYNQLPEEITQQITLAVRELPVVLAPLLIQYGGSLVWLSLLYMILLISRIKRQYRVAIMLAVVIWWLLPASILLYEALHTTNEVIYTTDHYTIIKLLNQAELQNICNNVYTYFYYDNIEIIDRREGRIWALVEAAIQDIDHVEFFKGGLINVEAVIRAHYEKILSDSINQIITEDNMKKLAAAELWHKNLYDNHPILEVGWRCARNGREFVRENFKEIVIGIFTIGPILIFLFSPVQ